MGCSGLPMGGGKAKGRTSADSWAGGAQKTPTWQMLEGRGGADG